SRAQLFRKRPRMTFQMRPQEAGDVRTLLAEQGTEGEFDQTIAGEAAVGLGYVPQPLKRRPDARGVVACEQTLDPLPQLLGMASAMGGRNRSPRRSRCVGNGARRAVP